VTKRTDHANQLDPLIREALAFVVRMKSGEATLADAERLVDWRAESPAHERAFRDAVRCWQLIGRSQANEPGAGPGRPRRKTKGPLLS
jgi:ferric-dicitrate binding protein FerR (iron transport regulator)